MKIENIKRLSSNFVKDAGAFSVAFACAKFMRDAPILSWEKRRTIYEESLRKYLRERYEKDVKRIIAEYRESEECADKKIWVMWWQGRSSMLPLVEACYNKILKECSEDYEVVLITKDNYASYVELPDYILKKVENGNITLTHISDIIRVMLLNKWGGIWLDATVYLHHLPEMIGNSKFFTLSGKGMFPDFISRGEWSPFMMATNCKNYLLMQCMEFLLLAYWKEHDCLIEYLLVDYFIDLVKHNSDAVIRDIQEVPYNNQFYELNSVLNQKYVKEEIEHIFSGSPLQKTSYKQQFQSQTPDGKETVYQVMLDGGL